MERVRKRQGCRAWEGKAIIHVGPGKTERHTRVNVPSCHYDYELENRNISTHYLYKMLF